MNATRFRVWQGLMAVIALWFAYSAALAQEAKPVPVMMKPVKALEPLQRIAGEFDVKSTEFRDLTKDDDDVTTTGSIRCTLRAKGHAFVIEKTNAQPGGAVYDDLMVFQNDQAAGKLKAFLFHPGAPKAREIDVEARPDGSLVLHYQPTDFGGTVIETRETITPQVGGKVTWLIERKSADGTFAKVRQIVGRRQGEK